MTRPRRSAAPGGRDSSLDNARALLIVLVVLGHTLEEVPADHVAQGVYRAIYQFHMPAFVLLTGYLSRRFTASIRAYATLVGALIVPYLILQLAHAVIEAIASGGPFDYDVLDPKWTLWYLLAVAVWRALTPILRMIPYAVPVAFAVAFGFSLLPDLTDTWSLDRIIVLLPFFVIGLRLTPEHLRRIRYVRTWPLTLFTILVIGGVAIGSLRTEVQGSDFWFSRTFAQLGEPTAIGFLLRAASYLLGLLGTVWVLSSASRRRLPWTFIGVNSLFVYLLHSLVLSLLRRDGVFEGVEEPWLLIGSVIISIGLAAALASPPVMALTRWAIQPPIGRLIDRVADPTPGRGRVSAQDRPMIRTGRSEHSERPVDRAEPRSRR